jgi:signal transduction histidine kinase
MLVEFASFLLDGQLEALAAANLRFARQLETALVRSHPGWSDDELLAALRRRLSLLLQGFQRGDAAAREIERLHEMAAVGESADVVLEAVEPRHLIVSYAAQKRALWELLPRFSADLARQEATREALEAHFTEVQSAAAEILCAARGGDRQQVDTLARALAREKAFLEAILGYVPAGIAYLDSSLRFRWVSNAFPRLLQIPEPALIGRRYFEVFPGTEPQVEAQLRGALAGEPFTASDFPFTYLLNGRPHESHWDFSYYPMREGPGDVEGVLILAIETSARVEKERLQREQIESLKRLDALKDEFLSVLSHELRTPLNCIMGFASVLERSVGLASADQRECVKEIDGNARRMLRLINDMLDIAKLKAGKIELHRQATELGPLLDEVVATLQPLIAEKRLRVETAAEVPGAACLDELRFTQVLTNLLSNAIKFTPPGGRIAIRARTAEAGLVVEVQDSGIGFREADQALLFQPFQQLNMSSTREAGGTGLGLSISKALVEAHDGRIEAESPGPGRGATFRVVLPPAALSEDCR